jgi:hypothetical protein
MKLNLSLNSANGGGASPTAGQSTILIAREVHDARNVCRRSSATQSSHATTSDGRAPPQDRRPPGRAAALAG